MSAHFFNPHSRICLSILERGEGRVERNIDMREEHRLVASCMSPDQGSNPEPFGVWDGAPTEPPGQGLSAHF